MRFLCLHRMGTSGAIFRAQTSAFRSKLDPKRYIFDFVDAPLDSTPAAGVDAFFPPPNYSFWHGVDPEDVKRAHEWLRDLLDRQGPYDGVACFSQGCSLIASFILYHKNERPEEPLPFGAAIFICGGIPLGVLSDLGLPISKESWDINDRTARELQEKAGAAAAEIQAILEGGLDERKGLWDRTGTLEQDPLAPVPIERTNVFGMNFARFPDTLKITIPTAHIYGSKDPRYPSSMQLIHFSDEEKRRIYDHAGGHDIPRTTVVSDAIAGLVKWLEHKSTE